MPSPRAELFGRVRRWLGPAALLALTPKCLLCLFGYAGITAALGKSRTEFCGATSSPGGFPSWPTALAWVGLIASGVVLWRRARHAPVKARPS